MGATSHEQRHLPQSTDIAGGPSEYFDGNATPANEAFEDRCYGHYAGKHIINPNDEGGSVRDGRDWLPIRQTNSSPKTGSFLIPRSTLGR